MSARDELIRFVEEEALDGPPPLLRETLEALLNAYAHELAEKQREHVAENVKRYGPSEADQGALDVADLIDPEVK